MITIHEREEGQKTYVELRGPSTETKPTTIEDKGVRNGSVFIETDTKEVFLFDEDSQEWM